MPSTSLRIESPQSKFSIASVFWWNRNTSQNVPTSSTAARKRTEASGVEQGLKGQQAISKFVEGAKVNRDHLLLGVVFILIGELFMVIMGSVIKHISFEVATIQIVFFRNLFGLFFITPVLFKNGAQAYRTQRLPLHFLRSLLGVAGMFCTFYVFANLKLAEAALFKLTAPLFIPLIAWFWLKEKASLSLLLCLGLGFVGVVIVMQPEHVSEESKTVMLIALFGAFMFGVAKVTIRKLGSTEPSPRIVFYFNLISMALSAIPAYLYWQDMDFGMVLWLLLFALLATIAQLFSTHAYTLAPAAKIGLYSYASVPFAGIIGWVVWNEAPYFELVLGSSLIFLAGFITFTLNRMSQAKNSRV